MAVFVLNESRYQIGKPERYYQRIGVMVIEFENRTSKCLKSLLGR